MEKESLEVIDAPENSIHLEYTQPSFAKRCFGNFLDIIFFVLAFISLFIGVQKTAEVTPQYRRADNIVATYREDSGLFAYAKARKTWENISTWLDNNNDTSFDFRVNRCQLAINDFITFVQNNASADQYNKIVKDYDDSRLSSKTVASNGEPLFIKNGEGAIVHNDYTVTNANGQYYYEHFYREYTLVNCGGFMLDFFPEYRLAMQSLSNIFFFIQLPITIISAGLIVYLLPAVIFRRGRSTFGKKLTQIGLVDSRVLSPSFGRYLARWAIFFFGEVVLGLFTFGIPLIISFSMMAFSKRRQGFPDYMLGLTEVNTDTQKIYFSKYEVALEFSTDHKEPIDFKLPTDV